MRSGAQVAQPSMRGEKGGPTSPTGSLADDQHGSRAVGGRTTGERALRLTPRPDRRLQPNDAMPRLSREWGCYRPTPSR